MAETSHLPHPPQPGSGQSRARRGPALSPSIAAGLLAFLAVVAGSVLLGLLGGLLWGHLAPRAVYVVVSRGTAQVVNPETGAFIAADGWFCVLGAAGGIVSGLLGYRLAVRRYGALPMLGVLGGGLAAAYVAMKLGQQAGKAQFYRLLASSKPGTQLRAPVNLGAHAALAFWPLAAGLVAGGIEAVVLLRQRKLAQRSGYRPGRAYASVLAARLPGPGRHGRSAGTAQSPPGEPGEPQQPGGASWRGEPPPDGRPGPGDTF